LISPKTENWAGKLLNLSSILSNLTFGCQNVNSLNVSTNCPKQAEKLTALTNSGCDIIFLSDLRLSNCRVKEDLAKFLLLSTVKQYQCFFNSTKNKRGAGVLISTHINFTVDSVYKDDSENIMGTFLTVGSEKIGLISVYGPNVTDNNFFYDLDRLLASKSDYKNVLAGDWNLTYATGGINNNIDIINMRAPPSQERSNRLQQICEKWELVDPYRALYPDSRDFTYIPRTGGQNRSRLDFFLIPCEMIDIIQSCKIDPFLTSKLYDHKMVKLNFCKPIFSKRKMIIRNEIISHFNFLHVVRSAAADTYINHACFDSNPEINLDALKIQTGRYISTIRELNDLMADLFLNGENDLISMEIAGKKQDLKEQSELLPAPDFFDNLVLTCNHDTFFEVLVNNLKNAVFSLQQWEKKNINAKKDTIVRELSCLKNNYMTNSDRIFELEQILNDMQNTEIKKKIEGMNYFKG